MTLGRTSSNKLKIKNGESLRAVSCGCCQSCGGFPAFSFGESEPTNKAKFKYITLEYQIPNYQFGEFDGSREPFYLSCSPYSYLDEEGNLVEGVTCGSFGEEQNIQSEGKYLKVTYYLKEDCSCDIVRATGWHHGARSFYSSWCNAYSDIQPEQYADCWVLDTDYEFSSTIQDAVWSTVTENGITLLKQKAQPAQWVSTACRGFLSNGDVSQVCPQGALACEILSFHGGNGEGLSGAVEGGFRVKSGNYTFPVFTYRATNIAGGSLTQTLHNTLSEIWGPTPEMRP